MMTQSGLGQKPAARIVSYGKSHLAKADEMLGHLVKIVRGDTELSPWQTRQLQPLRRKLAMRLAANLKPYLALTDVRSVLQIAR